MNRPIIGILTWRSGQKFAEPGYFRRLLQAGRELGAIVYLFAPQDVLPEDRRIRGFTPGHGRDWESRLYAWPDIVIDRYRYYPTPRHVGYLPFRRQELFRYVNSPLANKWSVYQVLAADEQMRRWLPETYIYRSSLLPGMLEKYSRVYIKPANGTGGRSILRIERTTSGFRIAGRTMRLKRVEGRVKTLSGLVRKVNHWVETEMLAKERCLIQQGLVLDLLPDRTVDLRLLIQKTADGQWDVTGQGIRMGRKNSSISNLHGGGKALPASRFLIPKFGRERTRDILGECHNLAIRTAQTLEQHYGRMIEFGLDIGIDVKGEAWLIEVNPKPGREIFHKIGQHERYRKAIRRPLEYTIFLLRQGSQPAEPAAEMSKEDGPDELTLREAANEAAEETNGGKGAFS
ncbi:YheC/YheD family protein [Brevibacillus sp. B_LB10_24]|uniref:YheC/YheD family endospore coat-associated protein n=1 Tax=Brevibacillus sp. B_LB10_24 TaxID=3380645 RepID=UPI0038B97AF0